MMRRVVAVAVLTAGLAVLAAPAWAHVTVRVDDASPGAYAEYTVRVPNESDSAATTLVEVQLPEGFAPLVAPVPGWDVTMEDRVLTLSGGSIAPGQYQDFTFVARNPEEGGEARFPAVQRYDDGEVAEWIGDEDADNPAALVRYRDEAVAGDAHEAGGRQDGAGAVPAGDAELAAAAAEEDAGGGMDWLGAAGLVAGLAGLVLAALAFARSGGAAAARRA